MTGRSCRRFGPFEFHPDTGELFREGRPVRLEPQPARLLAWLLDRPGQLVTREDIRRHVWGEDVHVDVDRGVAYALNQIRTALGDRAGQARFVETLPRRGYRFIAPVTDGGARESNGASRQGSPRRWLAVFAALLLGATGWLAVVRPWTPAPEVVVAVSVFDNETGQPEYDALVARMPDVVVARLVTAIGRRVGVIGNEAVLRRVRDERDLGVIRRGTAAEYVVLGQLQPDPGGLRIIAHLIRLDDGTHVWADRFIRQPGELGGFEMEVADGVVQAVSSHLLAPADTPVPDRAPTGF